MADKLNSEDPNSDLGLGSRVAQQSRLRFLNRDGTFNVKRKGLSSIKSLTLYHWLLTMSWAKYFSIILVAYLIANVLFAWGYILCGPDALHGSETAGEAERLLDAFFFSVQTSATIGYGRISPNGLAANILVTIEALSGLLGFALATGLLFARFSRPNTKIIFSNHAVIAPYKNMTAFMFRIANQRSSQLIEAQVTVVLSRTENINGKPTRKFYPLHLERDRVSFFPLHWVIVHPIDDESPFYEVTREAFIQSEPEVLILLSAVEETFSQTVHTRSSYKNDEIVWGAKFADMYVPDDDGMMAIDLNKLHAIEKIP
jgi:inward rectifier potassium channel